jgi:formylglycine-generating enzyme required for sulfatase activity
VGNFTNWFCNDERLGSTECDPGTNPFVARVVAQSRHTSTGCYEWKTAPGIVHWVDWAPDGRHLVTLNGNRTVYVLRLNQLDPVTVGPATFKNSIGMEFVKVPKGTGWLGGGSGKQGETKVVIEQDFYLGKYEVTQEEWEAVTGQNPSHFSRKGAGKDAVKDIADADLKRFPVENVSWDDCQLFIERLNEKEKDTGWVYRLPKEAEWEYACRGGPVDKLDSAFDFYFAKPTNTPKLEQANVQHVVGHSCKVGSYLPNQLGLYDMHGNVCEYCEDLFNKQGSRVLRSGGWMREAHSSRAAKRFESASNLRSPDFGLRLARVPVGPAVAVPSPVDKPK